MVKENHMGILQYCPKSCDYYVASTAGSNQSVIGSIIGPNKHPISHEVWLLDEVSLSSKINWEHWPPPWKSRHLWISLGYPDGNPDMQSHTVHN